jgi:CRISPR/Cas system-associated exonuclease Cas4 (RecB family)
VAIIRASEIAEYVYCARAWWLRRVEGATPDGAERRSLGHLRHARHGFGVAASTVLLRAAIVLVLTAGMLWLIGMLF